MRRMSAATSVGMSASSSRSATVWQSLKSKASQDFSACARISGLAASAAIAEGVAQAKPRTKMMALQDRHQCVVPE
jgi:hypothetical protein